MKLYKFIKITNEITKGRAFSWTKEKKCVEH